MDLLTVTGLNSYVESVLSGDKNLKDIYMKAEIADYKNHYSSGHRYMTLKDDNACISAVMFSSAASRLKFNVQNGMSVIVRGRAALYTKDGKYQFYINEMIPDGTGSASLAFEQLKNKLKAEGIFDNAHKKKIPVLPKRVGVITSDTGAAVRDICKILKRRCPMAEIVLAPVYVQGIKAAADLTRTLKKLDGEKYVDVIIIGRGGGTEDNLSAFNDEALVRAVYACETPIVSGIGHETDTTLCDYAADLAASTPSSAAEMISPSEGELESELNALSERLNLCIKRRLEYERKTLSQLTASAALNNPEKLLVNKKTEIQRMKQSLNAAYTNLLKNKKSRLLLSAGKLDTLSPLKVLLRGYTITTKDGKVMTSVESISADDIVNIRFSDGSAECKVVETKKG